MKLLQLFESDTSITIEEVIKKIKADCQPFLSATSSPMYRGSKTFDKEQLIQRQTVRMDRKPLDTTESVSKALDIALEPIAGFKPRSQAVFTTGNLKTTKSYGEPYLVFPIGDFEFIYSLVINDFYTDVLQGMDSKVEGEVFKIMASVLMRDAGVTRFMDIPGISEDELEYAKEEKSSSMLMSAMNNTQVSEVVTTLINTHKDWYQTSNIDRAIKSNKEIMIHCKEYYAVNILELSKRGYSAGEFIQELK